MVGTGSTKTGNQATVTLHQTRHANIHPLAVMFTHVPARICYTRRLLFYVCKLEVYTRTTRTCLFKAGMLVTRVCSMYTKANVLIIVFVRLFILVLLDLPGICTRIFTLMHACICLCRHLHRHTISKFACCKSLSFIITEDLKP